jgi:hypothetical protein
MTIELLEAGACLYWPAELANKASEVSSIGPLLETQDIFISFLTVADKTPTSWTEALQFNKKLSPNLFLKHLMVLSDIGGERLQRFSKDIDTIFPKGKFKFTWDTKVYEHEFRSAGSLWTNKNIRVEKSVLLENRKDFTDAMIDVCMLLMWGGFALEADSLPNEIIEKCNIGGLLGNATALENFIRQRYVVVSRQTGGSTANDLGHVCERYVKEKLARHLPSSVKFNGHTIPGITHNDRNLSTFDLVVECENNKYIGIEISFQVTTNSTIERKAGLSKSRKDLVNNLGHSIAYVIDGSGNFQRKNAIKTIMANSDFTVNFSDEGLENLAKYIIKVSQ